MRCRLVPPAGARMHLHLFRRPPCYAVQKLTAFAANADAVCPWRFAQGSGKDLIQPVLDNQLKTISPLVVPEGVRT